MELNLEKYKNKNIHVVGIAGAEGSAIASFLLSNVDCKVTGHDFSSDENEFRINFYKTHLSINSSERELELERLLNLPMKFHLKNEYLYGIEDADIIFVSQVWFKYPSNLPKLKELYDKGVEFQTITNLYFELVSCPIISVTGTNGKTTTSNLINSIFSFWQEENSGHCVYFAGNDRQNIQVLEELKNMNSEDVLILETSSTQLLLNSKISPHIGVITNITPNHLDDHGSFEKYIEAKENLIRYQKSGDFAVLNFDDINTRKLAEKYSENSICFSLNDELSDGCFLRNQEVMVRFNNEESKLFDISDLKIIGKHNLANAMAASLVSYLFGVDVDCIRRGVSAYRGIKHRLKLIYNIEGIRYFDDTQSTTPEATLVALDAFDDEIVLILGGDNKGMKYEKLVENIYKKAKIVILLPGDASDKIENIIDKNKIIFYKVNNFAESIEVIKSQIALNKIKTGDNVVISPAAAHFYSRFIETSGKNLKQWIKSISL